MLNAETKRHIDSARDILVGVVPNPTAQIDQITNALIYKFMDDMDQAAIKVGADPSFFTKDLEQYAWCRMMSDRLGNQERMNLYAEALTKFATASQLPQLFRDIFKSSFLPHRSPEVLGLFLKEIDYFDYAHSEDLGDAYEYLLQIMGSQGDAGQFRTPRHIIDFVVDVVNPTKDDKVLDPACGTAGFLISAYKHILEQHDGKNDLEQKEKPLTPEERKKLFANFEGYDIDPGMVRIAQVNMYLHQFKNPKVVQYDSLSQEERWSDKYDVILANPPFMSPRGGIRPHSKFSIQSNRSEVLFVDYIMNHLRPMGRAGIIVPEGIIFQSGQAYQKLRKALVEDGLYAVVSLPSGVFQPYSGVKTSILFFDNGLVKEANQVVFIDVKTIGYSLGATRTPTKENDLVAAASALKDFRAGKVIENNKLHFVVDKETVASKKYELSLAKYRQPGVSNGEKSFVALSYVCRITKGKSSSTKTVPGQYPLIVTAEEARTSDGYDFEGTGVCVPLISSTGHGKADIKRVHYVDGKFALANLLAFVEPIDTELLSPRYLYWVLDSSKNEMASLMKGAANVSMKVSDLESFNIPLPPLESQQQIVAELDGYQKIIVGARQIVDNWKPLIKVKSDWEFVNLPGLSQINPESIDPKVVYKDKEFIYIDIESVPNGGGVPTFTKRLLGIDAPSRARRKPQENDILISSVRPNLRAFALLRNLPKGCVVSTGFAILRANNKVLPEYLYYILLSDDSVQQMESMMGRGAYPSINQDDMSNIKIPLPPLEVQRQIVDAIEVERVHVESARTLIDLYTQKTTATIAKLWSK